MTMMTMEQSKELQRTDEDNKIVEDIHSIIKDAIDDTDDHDTLKLNDIWISRDDDIKQDAIVHTFRSVLITADKMMP